MLGAAYGTGKAVYELTYEDLQRDASATLSTFFASFLEVPLSDLGGTKAHHHPLATTKKFTPDDMQELLANFDAIKEYLERRFPCLVPQLFARGPASFAHCGALF